MSQNLEALARANDYRLARAAFRRDVGGLPTYAGCGRVAEFLAAEIPPWARNWAISDLLRCVHRMGAVFIRPLLAAAECSELRPLSALTTRQISELIVALNDRAGR